MVLAETPSWARIACDDLLSGKWSEVKGEADNPLIVSCWDYVDERPKVHSDAISWCSSYINRVMELAGYRGTRSPAARSWVNWGAELRDPRVGAIAVFWRVHPRSWTGHVGILLGWSRVGMITLGGNQSDRLSVISIPRTQLLSLRWAREEDRLCVA